MVNMFRDDIAALAGLQTRGTQRVTRYDCMFCLALYIKLVCGVNSMVLVVIRSD